MRLISILAFIMLVLTNCDHTMDDIKTDNNENDVPLQAYRGADTMVVAEHDDIIYLMKDDKVHYKTEIMKPDSGFVVVQIGVAFMFCIFLFLFGALLIAMTNN